MAELAGADLNGANLRRTDLRQADLSAADLSGSDLCEADLRNANLREARLDRSRLNDANLRYANLRYANLVSADLSGANLRYVVLRRSNLSNANLRNANLRYTAFSECELAGASFAGAELLATTFAGTDLSGVEGLAEVRHCGPSTVGVDSILKSRGAIPEAFLRGCGLRDQDMRYLLAQSGAEFHSCFISYASDDDEFAARLYGDLQNAGIRCWKWDHDAKTGRSLWGEIDDAIRGHDKLVLIASEASLTSPAVNREIERAIVQEDERSRAGGDRDVLFPVRLDEYIFEGWAHERRADVLSKVIADARGWQGAEDVYKRVLERLVRDLKAGRRN